MRILDGIFLRGVAKWEIESLMKLSVELSSSLLIREDVVNKLDAKFIKRKFYKKF